MRPFVKNILNVIVFSLLASLLVYFTFFYKYAFNYEVDITHYKLLFLFLVLVILLPVIYSFCHETLYTQTGKWLALSGILVVFCFSSMNGWTNEYLTVLIVITSAFVIASFTLSVRLLYVFIGYIVIIYLYEIGLGLYQVASVEPYAGNKTLLIQGSLHNSGIYACYLVAHLPMISFFVFNDKSDCKHKIQLYVKNLLFIIYLFVLLLLLFYTQSRTAIIAFLFSVTLLQGKLLRSLYNRFKNTILFKGIVLVMVPAFIASGYYLFKMKHMSAIGRLLGWQITFNHFTDSLWLGKGPGSFTWHYPQWQMEYFKTHAGFTDDYFLSAGESYLIFNEYLQLFKEVGVVGFVVFLWAVYYFFKARSYQYTQLLTAAKITIATVLSCAFTSYPFHSTPLLFLLGFCLMVISIIRDDGFFKRKPASAGSMFNVFRGVCLIVLMVSVYFSFTSIKFVIADNKLTHLREDCTFTRDEAYIEFARLYPVLYHDGKFLTEYGEFLLKDSAGFLKGLQLLEQSRKSFISFRTVNSIAEGYKLAGDTSNAIKNYEWLNFYLPNRFKIKFQLLKLYEASKDTLRAKQVANTILNMPVKVPSKEVFDIRDETRHIVNQLNNIQQD